MKSAHVPDNKKRLPLTFPLDTAAQQGFSSRNRESLGTSSADSALMHSPEKSEGGKIQLETREQKVICDVSGDLEVSGHAFPPKQHHHSINRNSNKGFRGNLNGRKQERTFNNWNPSNQQWTRARPMHPHSQNRLINGGSTLPFNRFQPLPRFPMSSPNITNTPPRKSLDRRHNLDSPFGYQHPYQLPSSQPQEGQMGSLMGYPPMGYHNPNEQEQGQWQSPPIPTLPIHNGMDPCIIRFVGAPVQQVYPPYQIGAAYPYNNMGQQSGPPISAPTNPQQSISLTGLPAPPYLWMTGQMPPNQAPLMGGLPMSALPRHQHTPVAVPNMYQFMPQGFPTIQYPNHYESSEPSCKYEGFVEAQPASNNGEEENSYSNVHVVSAKEITLSLTSVQSADVVPAEHLVSNKSSGEHSLYTSDIQKQERKIQLEILQSDNSEETEASEDHESVVSPDSAVEVVSQSTITELAPAVQILSEYVRVDVDATVPKTLTHAVRQPSGVLVVPIPVTTENRAEADDVPFDGRFNNISPDHHLEDYVDAMARNTLTKANGFGSADVEAEPNPIKARNRNRKNNKNRKNKKYEADFVQAPHSIPNLAGKIKAFGRNHKMNNTDRFVEPKSGRNIRKQSHNEASSATTMDMEKNHTDGPSEDVDQEEGFLDHEEVVLLTLLTISRSSLEEVPPAKAQDCVRTPALFHGESKTVDTKVDPPVQQLLKEHNVPNSANSVEAFNSIIAANSGCELLPPLPTPSTIPNLAKNSMEDSEPDKFDVTQQDGVDGTEFETSRHVSSSDTSVLPLSAELYQEQERLDNAVTRPVHDEANMVDLSDSRNDTETASTCVVSIANEQQFAVNVLTSSEGSTSCVMEESEEGFSHVENSEEHGDVPSVAPDSTARQEESANANVDIVDASTANSITAKDGVGSSSTEVPVKLDSDVTSDEDCEVPYNTLTNSEQAPASSLSKAEKKKLKKKTRAKELKAQKKKRMQNNSQDDANTANNHTTEQTLDEEMQELNKMITQECLLRAKKIEREAMMNSAQNSGDLEAAEEKELIDVPPIQENFPDNYSNFFAEQRELMSSVKNAVDCLYGNNGKQMTLDAKKATIIEKFTEVHRDHCKILENGLPKIGKKDLEIQKQKRSRNFMKECMKVMSSMIPLGDDELLELLVKQSCYVAATQMTRGAQLALKFKNGSRPLFEHKPLEMESRINDYYMNHSLQTWHGTYPMTQQYIRCTKKVNWYIQEDDDDSQKLTKFFTALRYHGNNVFYQDLLFLFQNTESSNSQMKTDLEYVEMVENVAMKYLTCDLCVKWPNLKKIREQSGVKLEKEHLLFFTEYVRRQTKNRCFGLALACETTEEFIMIAKFQELKTTHQTSFNTEGFLNRMLAHIQKEYDSENKKLFEEFFFFLKNVRSCVLDSDVYILETIMEIDPTDSVQIKSCLKLWFNFNI